MKPLDDDPVKGRWELRLRLPQELSAVEQLTLHPHTSATMEEDGDSLSLGPAIELAAPFRRKRDIRIVLAAPRRGWNPPSWLREYLRDNNT